MKFSDKWRFIIPLFLILFSLSIFLWEYFDSIDKKLRDSEVKTVEKQATTRIEDNFKIRIDAIKLLTLQLKLQPIDSLTFIKDAKLYYDNYSGFQAINWVNNKGVIEWVYPFKGNEGAYGKNLHFHPDPNCRKTFAEAEKTVSIQITPVIKLLQGGYGVVIYSPVVKNGKLIGYVNGVFNVNSFFDNILKDFSPLFSIEISRGNTVYYKKTGGKNIRKYTTTRFNMGTDTFSFFLGPKKERPYRNIKNLVILILGILFSFSLSFFVWLLFKNIDEQKAAKSKIYGIYKAISVKQRELDAIIENNPDAIIKISRNGKILRVNNEFYKVTGYDKHDKYPNEIFAYWDGENRALLKAKIDKSAGRKKAESILDIEITKKDGKKAILELSIIPVVYKGKCDYLWIFSRDLTEFNRLKEKNEQKSKMEAIGKVTGRVAHDFNNILTGIIGYSDMILNKDNLDAKVREYAENIKNAGLSVKNLTKDLLQLSKKQTLNKEIFDLNEMISKNTAILKKIVKKDVCIKLELAKTPCMINADRTKMESVLLNLITNASDAIDNNGAILIKTSHTERNNASYVVLSVKDNGKGIPNEIINRIFEPFFTTKGSEKGTGLGLSIVYGVVNQHGGTILVKSKVGKGTVFEISIPEVENYTKVFPSIADRTELGSGKILLVDDDRNALEVIGDMIQNLGYKVTSVDNPMRAISLYKKSPDDFDLIISDYFMPDMNGADMLGIMAGINPALKAFIISGFIENSSVLNSNKFIVLMKPFSSEELSRVISKLL